MKQELVKSEPKNEIVVYQPNETMRMENMVAQMIRASGRGLYFCSNADRANAENRMEIDFLICDGIVYLPLYMAGLLAG